MFGRRPRLPIDLVFDKARDHADSKNLSDYVDQLREAMVKTREIVDSHLKNAKKKQKKYYDQKARAVQLAVGNCFVILSFLNIELH